MDTKKLRQKILDLAIRGKLVPQDPNDEPASVLLERIKEEKERLIKEGKIRKSKKGLAKKMDLELKEIELAAKRLEPTIHRTKIESSKTFSDMTGGEIYLKFENQQKTGSFKIRGASNKIAALVERGEITSAVASSAGNHAQGVAYASHVHNIPATIVMPKSAPVSYTHLTLPTICSV